MATLATPRLLLVPLSRSVMAARAERVDLTLECETPEGVLLVRFGQEWSGDTAGLFPDFLRYLGDAEYVDGRYVVVERATQMAIGHVGTVGVPDDRGAVEIGYGIEVARAGNGFATEAVSAITAHLLGVPGVAQVTARTAVGNTASQRVLEGNGFVRAEHIAHQEDELVLWVRQRGG